MKYCDDDDDEEDDDDDDDDDDDVTDRRTMTTTTKTRTAMMATHSGRTIHSGSTLDWFSTTSDVWPVIGTSIRPCTVLNG